MWEWIAEYAGTRDAPLSLRTVCAACVSLTGMTGAWVSRGDAAADVAYATDPVAERLADLQILLGEGPGVDARQEGRPVAVTDLSIAARRRTWPRFAPAALAAGSRSALVVPMRVGAARIGLFGLYSRTPAVLVTTQRTEVDAFAEVALGLVLDDITRQPPDLGQWASDRRALDRPEVHQATGIVSVQLGIDVTESLARLRAHAYAHARPLLEIAREVVTRRLRFSPNTSERGIPGP
ncbi:MAG TPA: GAF and ANTAR domain-containing protein [Actinophytocola sp.]|nr:GAF and ANTAR domain-containing protein [Actinophytocola sp.]